MEAVGRPGGDRLHRRPRDRRDARPQRPAARAAGSRRTTAGSCSRPRPACSTSPPENIVRKGRLQPGKLFLVDLEQGRIVPDEEVKRDGRDAAAVRRVVRARGRAARRPAARASRRAPPTEPLRQRQLAFGYSQEDMKVILAPLARNAEEAVGSMGNDTAARGALRPPAAPLLVLQAAVRAGDEPADRLDPRGGRDERAGERRLRAEPARRDARARAPARDRQPDPARRRARAAAPGATPRSSRRARST